MTIRKNFCIILIGLCLISFSIGLYSNLLNQKSTFQENEIYKSLGFLKEEQLKSAWGGQGNDIAFGIDTDSLGNIYLTGYTYSYGAGGADWFLIKYDSSGVKKWNITWGGVDEDVGNDIAISDTGDIFITGGVKSFGARGIDSVLMKYNNQGIKQWNVTWGGPKNDVGNNIVLSDSNKICITGSTDSYGVGGFDAFLLQYDISGNLEKNLTWGGNKDEGGMGIALDNSENIYISGGTRSYGNGERDVFLIKYDSFGNQEWNKTWGGVNDDLSMKVVTDHFGNIYITGFSYSFNSEGGNAILLKYDRFGEKLQNITWGGTANDVGNGIAIDDANNIYVTGMTYIYNPEAENYGGMDVFVNKYDSSLLKQWETKWGGKDSDRSFCMTIDNQNNIYVAGASYNHDISDYNVFLLRFNTHGALIWNIPSISTENPIIMIILIIILVGGIVAGVFGLTYYIILKRKEEKKESEDL
jgi:hypothetical protein